ncbi:uncharacterized protein LOC123503656 isoform X2 [Portunus trituberculatus]|uniref:uncharacterized protein LOC123503656 isoform X2 n=1 Tax=Portunus trituberculatus TaxID=210409 RepID=UPI001E1CD11B|nr:uncharacterized protein LOC123503656 isoform X2 [Portunus trituberculatus]
MCNTASRTGLLLFLIIVGSECVRQKRQDLIPSPRVGKRVVLRGDSQGDVDILLKGLADTGDIRPELLREGEEDWTSILTGPGHEPRLNTVNEWLHQSAASRRPRSHRREQAALSPAHLQALVSTLYNCVQRVEALISDTEESDSRSKLAL